MMRDITVYCPGGRYDEVYHALHHNLVRPGRHQVLYVLEPETYASRVQHAFVHMRRDVVRRRADAWYHTTRLSKWLGLPHSRSWRADHSLRAWRYVYRSDDYHRRYLEWLNNALVSADPRSPEQVLEDLTRTILGHGGSNRESNRREVSDE